MTINEVKSNKRKETKKFHIKREEGDRRVLSSNPVTKIYKEEKFIYINYDI